MLREGRMTPNEVVSDLFGGVQALCNSDDMQGVEVQIIEGWLVKCYLSNTMAIIDPGFCNKCPLVSSFTNGLPVSVFTPEGTITTPKSLEHLLSLRS